MRHELLNIELLPFWGGVSKQPQEVSLLPFRLEWDSAGYCRQFADSEVMGKVINRYEMESYTYLTPPPGASLWANHLGSIQEEFVKEFSESGVDMLEIGAGSTYLAEQLISVLRPRRYVIIDPAISEGGNADIEIVKSYFPFSNKTKFSKFDTVLCFNALEHTDEPIVFLQGIANLLKPDGKGLICVPDVTNAFNRGDLNELMHEHISYFTPETFEIVAMRAGLEVKSMLTEDDTLWAVVGIGPAEERCALTPDVFIGLGPRFISPINSKAEFIRNILRSGKKIGFHGATNGLCNFLHLSGLSLEREIVIFDADESKHGLYVPGSPNPIVSPHDPNYSKMALMYVSAMTYFETIRQFAQSRSLELSQIKPLFD